MGTKKNPKHAPVYTWAPFLGAYAADPRLFVRKFVGKGDKNKLMYIRICIYTYIIAYIHIYIYSTNRTSSWVREIKTNLAPIEGRTCVCVCVCARARAQARHGKVSEGKSKYILSFSMSLSLRENLSTSFFFSLSLNDFFPLECLSCTMTRTQTHTQTLPYYRMCSLTIECVLSFSMSL